MKDNRFYLLNVWLDETGSGDIIAAVFGIVPALAFVEEPAGTKLWFVAEKVQTHPDNDWAVQLYLVREPDDGTAYAYLGSLVYGTYVLNDILNQYQKVYISKFGDVYLKTGGGI